MSPPILALLTDFGVRDEYVGAVKGVLLSRCPGAVLVDITHEIDPGDIAGAAFRFEAVFPYFPAGTVHLLVVDPGVGGDRAVLALAAGNQRVVAPDNGLVTPLLESGRVDAAVRVTDFDRFGPRPGETFHGRDVFAPVAAELACGAPLEALGETVSPDALVCLDRPRAAVEKGAVRGRVVGVDRFGNLISNIRRSHLAAVAEDSAGLAVRVGSLAVAGLHRCFSDVPPGMPLAYIGGRGLLEVAVNGGNAAKRFGVETGAEIGVFSPPVFGTRPTTGNDPVRRTRQKTVPESSGNPSAIPGRFRGGRARGRTGRFFGSPRRRR
jgi:S-adenosyl-L-methionine hydrolase (adenosine-forming)